MQQTTEYNYLTFYNHLCSLDHVFGNKYMSNQIQSALQWMETNPNKSSNDGNNANKTIFLCLFLFTTSLHLILLRSSTRVISIQNVTHTFPLLRFMIKQARTMIA